MTLIAPWALGQDPAAEIESFRLYNACRPMWIVVENLPEDATAIGLDRPALQAAVESRLRAARLYTEELSLAAARLYVNVNVVTTAFSISLEYDKNVTDAFGKGGLATTLNIPSTGTHGGEASYIVSGLSQHLDRFLAAYLRVNEAACG